MVGNEVPIDIINLTAMKLVFADVRTQERLVIVAGNKTNFLTIDFVGDL